MEHDFPKQIFVGYKFYILPARLGSKRLSILKDNVQKMGGTVLTSEQECENIVTYVVVEDSFANKPEKCYELVKGAGVDCSHLEVVTTKWLTSCLKEHRVLETEPYRIQAAGNEGPRNARECSPRLDQANSNCEAHSETYVVCKQRDDSNATYSQSSPSKKRKISVEKFASLQMPDKEISYNKNIIAELEKLADTFRSSGDQWRAHGYDKAIASVKAYGKDIKKYEEAVALPGIGKKMADKIMEIIEIGNLQKVDEVCNSEKSKTINSFTKIWGVGPATAQSWYVQGFRTLEDLNSKANLTKQQRIALKYFEELQERIPREEVQQIGNIVKENAVAVNPDVAVILCGSYRRGKSTCGDIDVLLLTEMALDDLLVKLMERLKVCGLITDDLTNTEDSGGHKKYLGICQLEGGRHRRIDIFVAPMSEMATALMHYTGSALFNRSLRLLAAEKGMYLSEHCLMSGVMREGSKILNEGLRLQTPTEESIFQHLGLKYKSPEERDQ